MPSYESLILVTIAGFALSASPGPSMLYVLSRSIGQDRSAGLVSAAGLATGGMVHVVAAAAGLTALISCSAVAYHLVTVLGGAYLVYLGVRMYRSRNESLGSPDAVHRLPFGRIYYQGILVEVLNPKTAVFFLAFLPQFVNQKSGSVIVQLVILGVLIPLTAVPSDLLVAFTGGTIARKLSANKTLSVSLNCLASAILIGLGIRIFLDAA